MEKKFVNLWLVLKNNSSNPADSIGSYYFTGDGENSTAGQYYESFFSGYLSNYWKKQAYPLLDKALEMMNFDILDVKNIFAYYDNYSLKKTPLQRKDGVIYLGEIGFDFDYGVYSRLKNQYSKLKNIKSFEKLFENAPFDKSMFKF